jgi:hypothetical protein
MRDAASRGIATAWSIAFGGRFAILAGGATALPLDLPSLARRLRIEYARGRGCLLRWVLFPAASAHEVDVLHRQRLAFVRPRPFPCDALDDYHRFLIQRVQIGYNTGWCRFVDEQHNVWLPTFIGAFRVYFKIFGFLLSRMVYSDRRRLKRRVNLQETTTPGL